MNHITVHCSLCNKELHIKVAAGFKTPDTCMCKACSQAPQRKSFPYMSMDEQDDYWGDIDATKNVNLAKAQRKGKFWKLDRAIKRSD